MNDSKTTFSPEKSLTKWQNFVSPTKEGLPNNKVLGIPLGFLSLLFVLLVCFGITGSSTGYFNQFFSNTSDSRLLAGSPKAIRSDEWNVQTTWTISQVEQGLPVINQTFPGGMDATVQHDLPSTDWSVIFRPHLLGFLFLPLDQAMAWKWWLPGFILIASIYFFGVTLLPRRPIFTTLLAIGFFFSPFFQWWYLSITFYPPAWAFLLMATGIWLLRTNKTKTRIFLSVLVGYLAVTVGTGIYVPFIVPSALVAAAFLAGFVLTKDSTALQGLLSRLKKLAGIGIAGLAALAVLGCWILTRLPTIQGFLGTVYPGQRIQLVGQASRADVEALFGGIFAIGVGKEGASPLGVNASEASTFLLPGLFVLGTVLALVISRWINLKGTDGVGVALLGLFAVGVLYFVIPYWDFAAKLLLLDRTTLTRFRLEFGLLSLLTLFYLVWRFDSKIEVLKYRSRVLLAFLGVTLAVIVNGYLIAELSSLSSPVITKWTLWMLIGVLFLITIFFIGSRRPVIAASSFLVMSLLAGGTVNPIYIGVYDLNDTEVAKEIKALPEAKQVNWVGVGLFSTAVLVQSGLHGYSGFQSSPSTIMWQQIDPTGEQNQAWNRLAFVGWTPGEGEPKATNPFGDQIALNFDSCSQFAQLNVEYVLSESEIKQPCISEVDQVEQGSLVFHIYQIR